MTCGAFIALGCRRCSLPDDLADHHRDDDLVRLGFFGGRAGSGSQLAIVRTQRRAFSLSAIPGKCRRSSTTAESSPLSSYTRRMASAVAKSTLNMPQHERVRTVRASPSMLSDQRSRTCPMEAYFIVTPSEQPMSRLAADARTRLSGGYRQEGARPSGWVEIPNYQADFAAGVVMVAEVVTAGSSGHAVPLMVRER